MDSQEKYMSWVGNMCKKVGTLCSRINSIISEESFRYAEDQLLATGENVKQFCSQWIEEVLPDLLKDPSQEETLFLDEPSEILKKDNDKGHQDQLSKSNSCDRISVSELSVIGKQTSLEQNPTEDQVDLRVLGFHQSRDGGIEGKIDLRVWGVYDGGISSAGFDEHTILENEVKFDKGWEFIETSGSEEGKGLKPCFQSREPKFNNDHDFCESDWEMV